MNCDLSLREEEIKKRVAKDFFRKKPVEILLPVTRR